MWTAALLLVSCLGLVVQAQQCGTSRRRPWRSLSCAEQDTFLNAVMLLKDSGVYDDIAVVHASTGPAAHNVPAFLPWHRYYTWVFERELQRVTGSCITVPYWDWERAGSIATVLGPNSFGSENPGCVTDGIASGWNDNNGCLERAFRRQFSLSTGVEVLSRITNSPTFVDFSVLLEGAPHTAVHSFVGGSMASMSSPYGT
jgi:Common central domain of tyrosinase